MKGRCPKCRARFTGDTKVCRDKGCALDGCTHIYNHVLIAQMCEDCNHYLSLGPANMTDEAKVELDAARLAENETRDGIAAAWFWATLLGPPRLDQVFRLALQIATHDEEGK